MIDIAVIGETLLDVERHGVLRDRAGDRIPVIREHRCVAVPGGAGNTAANAARLGARTALWGPVGDDLDGRQVCSLLDAIGVHRRLSVVPGWITPRKERIFDLRGPVLRVDRERPHPLAASDPDPMLGDGGWQAAKMVVCSDYGQGAWSEARAVAIVSAAEGRVIADVRSPPSWWRGARIWCPNEEEARAATGGQTLDDALDRARACLPGTILAITRGAGGVLWDDGQRHALDARGPEPTDPVGAGDTFAAALAVALAEGESPRAAARWGIAAAGFSASQPGTYAVARHEFTS